MTPANDTKRVVQALVNVLSLGIHHEKIEEAETVLAGARILRPKLAELDTFEAWIAMKRRRWAEALQILRNLDVTAPNWALGKALMTVCQFVTGDAAWQASANEVLQNSQSVEARNLVRLLLDPTAEEEPSAGPVAAPAPAPAVLDYAANTYLRA